MKSIRWNDKNRILIAIEKYGEEEWFDRKKFRKSKHHRRRPRKSEADA
ncbi:MAG: hypothetical protein MRY83_22195 [Flavobacteriales bacterium]|nr:hypothetical protein [Flavobacteriales bacterium]